jgi:uncharacterized protein (TIGR02466 family)
MDLKVNNGITLCWGTPVFAFKPENDESVIAELKRVILERKASHQGLHKSNFGGWHSSDDLLTWPSPATQKLQGWIVEAFKLVTQRTGQGVAYKGQVHLTGWANVNGPRDTNDVHNHPQCAWSGVYYIDVGTPVDDAEKSGFIHFMDPRPGAGMVPDPFAQFGKGREFKPTTGQMLLFPSWLMHGVRPYRGEGERISVAFNITLLDLM